MWVSRIRTAESDDFAIANDRSFFIFPAVLTQVTLHQPGFCVVRIDFQNAIEEDLGNAPTFLRNRSSGV